MLKKVRNREIAANTSMRPNKKIRKSAWRIEGRERIPFIKQKNAR